MRMNRRPADMRSRVSADRRRRSRRPRPERADRRATGDPGSGPGRHHAGSGHVGQRGPATRHHNGTTQVRGHGPQRMRIEGGGYRRDHLRALAQRVEVADREVRIMGSKSDLLRTLAAISGVKSATGGVRSSVLDWRREWDSNPRYGFPHTRFPSVRLKPLGHLSGCPVLKG
jgi:hypothetical protein